jgi:hypothetical protein
VLAVLYSISQLTVSRIYRSIMPLLDQVLCVHELELTSVFVNRTTSMRRPAVERALGRLKNWKILATDSPKPPTSMPVTSRLELYRLGWLAVRPTQPATAVSRRAERPPRHIRGVDGSLEFLEGFANLDEGSCG